MFFTKNYNQNFSSACSVPPCSLPANCWLLGILSDKSPSTAPAPPCTSIVQTFVSECFRMAGRKCKSSRRPVLSPLQGLSFNQCIYRLTVHLCFSYQKNNRHYIVRYGCQQVNCYLSNVYQCNLTNGHGPNTSLFRRSFVHCDMCTPSRKPKYDNCIELEGQSQGNQ